MCQLLLNRDPPLGVTGPPFHHHHCPHHSSKKKKKGLPITKTGRPASNSIPKGRWMAISPPWQDDLEDRILSLQQSTTTSKPTSTATTTTATTNGAGARGGGGASSTAAYSLPTALRWALQVR